MDEATSSFDTETEKDIQEHLYRMLKGRTVISIAHRLSTVVNNDLIVVLENGEILERGSHQELLEMKGRYSKMWSSQAKNN